MRERSWCSNPALAILIILIEYFPYYLLLCKKENIYKGQSLCLIMEKTNILKLEDLYRAFKPYDDNFNLAEWRNEVKKEVGLDLEMYNLEDTSFERECLRSLIFGYKKGLKDANNINCIDIEDLRKMTRDLNIKTKSLEFVKSKYPNINKELEGKDFDLIEFIDNP